MTSDNAHYTATAKLLHWVIAGLILLQFVLAQLADLAEGNGAVLRQLALLANHKSVGVTIFVLVLGRIVWRVMHPPPPLPATLPKWQVVASAVSHWALYGLIIAVPSSGWLMSDASAYAASWFNLFSMPDIIETDAAVEELSKEVHEVLAYVLLLVSGLHILAAAKHAVLDRDTVLSRIVSRTAVALFVVILLFGGTWLGSAGQKNAIEIVGPSSNAATDEGFVPSELPVWRIDFSDSFIRFTGEQAGAAFNGEWTSWSAELRFSAAEVSASSFDVIIATTDVATQDEERDTTLAEADWFDSERFPSATYRAATIRKDSNGQYIADGQLTIKNLTAPVSLTFSVEVNRANRVLEGTAKLDRLALGVGTGEWADTDWVGQFVEVSVRVSATVDQPPRPGR